MPSGRRFARKCAAPLLFGTLEGSATRWRDAELVRLSEYITGMEVVKPFFRVFLEGAVRPRVRVCSAASDGPGVRKRRSELGPAPPVAAGGIGAKIVE